MIKKLLHNIYEIAPITIKTKKTTTNKPFSCLLKIYRTSLDCSIAFLAVSNNVRHRNRTLNQHACFSGDIKIRFVSKCAPTLCFFCFSQLTARSVLLAPSSVHQLSYELGQRFRPCPTKQFIAYAIDGAVQRVLYYL